MRSLPEFEVGIGAYRFDPAAEAPELPPALVRAAGDQA